MTQMVPVIDARMDAETGLWLEEVFATGPFETVDLVDWCRRPDTDTEHLDIVDAWRRGDEITTVRPGKDEESEWKEITAAVRCHFV
jgi:hypothetical protein